MNSTGKEQLPDPVIADQTSDANLAQESARLEETTEGVVHRWYIPQLEAEVWLPQDVLTTLKRFVAEALPNETGGTLVGHYTYNGRIAWIEQGLGVRRGAQASRTSFYRPADVIDGQLAEIYRASSACTYYLGEWHSHPGSTTGPSPTDLHTMHDLACSPLVATDTPILLILEGHVGTSPTLCCRVVERLGGVLGSSYLGVALPRSGESSAIRSDEV
jgi:integrative and conjugative element protein (TIGR02256 family)